MRLGILVVYYLADRDIDILNLHLRAIAAHTDIPFCIYGVANRVSEKVLARLRAEPFVTLIDIPPCGMTGSLEHSYYLDRLAEYACRQGVSHLCTLDVDSYPIKSGWATVLASRLTPMAPLAAVLRLENGDRILPHPSCSFFSRDFFLAYEPNFYPVRELHTNIAFKSFLNINCQRPDSGIGYAFVLASRSLQWHQLLRSNRVNDHYLMAGIYGDLIFHLGATSWLRRIFRGDKQRSRLYQLAIRLKQPAMPRVTPALSIHLVGHCLERLAELTLMLKNNWRYRRLRARLLADPEGYLRYLRGCAPHAKHRS